MNHHPLWAAIANFNQPEIVVKAHSNFIQAGADIIVTNTYKTNVPNLMEIMNYTAEEATQVRVQFSFHILVKLFRLFVTKINPD